MSVAADKTADFLETPDLRDPRGNIDLTFREKNENSRIKSVGINLDNQSN